MEIKYISSSEAARILGIRRTSVARLVRRGRLPVMKVANRWLLEKTEVEEIAKTYVGRRGRPLGGGPKKEVHHEGRFVRKGK